MEFTREKLAMMGTARGGMNSWAFMGESFEVRALAEFALRQLNRAEVAEGWSLHWKGEAERFYRELYLARFQHANREAPAEQNPTPPTTPSILPPKPWPEGIAEVIVTRSQDGTGTTSEIRITVPGFVDGARLRRVAEAARGVFVERNPPLIVGDIPNHSGSGGVQASGFVSIHPLPENPPSVTTVGEFIPGALEAIDSDPQRPHESLIWAIYHSVYVQKCSEAAARDLANDCVENWRRRWPEGSE